MVAGEGGRVTLAARVQVRPAGLDGDTDKLTVPVKLFTAVTVIVEVPEAPARIWLGETAPAAMLKSTTWNTMLAVVFDLELLVPVTVTV